MITPKQKTHVRKKIIRLSDAPASASGPSRPIRAVSVVSIATHASWVKTIGAPGRAISASSIRQNGLGAAVPCEEGVGGRVISVWLFPVSSKASRQTA